MTRPATLRLGVLISGGGRTLLNLHEKIQDGSLAARIDAVVASRGKAPGVQRAQEAGLPVRVVERQEFDDASFQQAITREMDEVDLVCMAGFLFLWHIPEAFAGRVINIHPALLPAFGGRGMYGLRVHRAVLAAGHSESGCTAHFCDNEYDHGPIILQRRVPVLPDDTPASLAARVFEQECVAYPAAIRLFCENRVRLVGNQTVISPP